MATLIMGPGSAHSAAVTVNVVPAGLAMQLEVWVGPNQATKTSSSGLLNFTSTGSNQVVPAPVTMPNSGTLLSTFVDVLYQGAVVASYVATDKITILGVSVGPITWS